MGRLSRNRQRLLRIVFVASICASVLLLIIWIGSYFMGFAILGNVGPTPPSAGLTSAPAAPSSANVDVPAHILSSGGVLLFHKIHGATPSVPLPRIMPLHMGMPPGRSGFGHFSRSLIPTMGPGLWIPLWMPLVLCAIPGVVCRRKLNFVPTRRVRRTGVPKARRIAAVAGAFLITSVLAAFGVKAILAESLQNSDVVSGMRQAWDVSEQSALLVLISMTVAIGSVVAYVVDYILAWKRVPNGTLRDVSGPVSPPQSVPSS